MARDFMQMYKDKLQTAAEAAKIVESGDWIDYAMFNGKPVAFDAALAERKAELSDVKLMTAVTVPPIPQTVMQDVQGEVFTWLDLHFSAATRIMQQMCGGVFYHPVTYGESDNFFRFVHDDPIKSQNTARKACIVRTTPMDKHGFFNFGIHNSVTYSQLESAQYAVVEINENIPWAYGGNRERIHISDVDIIIESENDPLFELANPEPTETDMKIAHNVLDFIRDGDCVQLGIGAMPNSLGKMIAETDLKNLSGQTEMLVDAYMDLVESGKMNGKYSLTDTNRVVYTFALGGRHLYEWIDHNPGIASYEVYYANHPLRISSIDNLISVNQCLQVDLYGQVNAESNGFQQVSGNGGMTDFVNAAYWSKGGRSMICLPSTHTKKDGTVVSRIVPFFEHGTIVTIPRQTAHMIVTEYGVAALKANCTWVRAEKLINIAHPDFRDELIKHAQNQKIWRRSNKIE
ncbi:MAG: acetyl-CoA hydrolase/transferase C-terminal domain-containing protein [Syntrophomonadaceae bacterium]|nr:acetyl-CoA hydrolase/transferase C-terminal domain-containing protein [Syntrophomonadaceae bacterium]